VTVGPIDAVTTLLVQAEAAHGVYETTELNGVYDREWARWYAAYAVDHGLGAIVGRDITTDRMADLLATSFAEFQRADPKPVEPWSAYAARRIVAEV
jgi:hypothetical protein